MPKSAGPEGTFVIFPNQKVTADTPISPFWKREDEFWTSNDLRNTSVFGYTYPELQWWNYPSAEALRVEVNATIAKNYGSSARSRLKSTGQTGGELTRLLQDDDYFTDWTIEATASDLDLPPTFQVQFSLVGDFSSSATAEVGRWIRLMPSDHANEAREAHRAARKAKRTSTLARTVEYTVSLTASLLDQIEAGKLESLDPSDVVSYLKSSLTWNVFAVSVLPSFPPGG